LAIFFRILIAGRKALPQSADSGSAISLKPFILHPLQIFFNDFRDGQFIGAPGHAVTALRAIGCLFPHYGKYRIFHCARSESSYEGTGAHYELDWDVCRTGEAIIAAAAKLFVILLAYPLDGLLILCV
jgi:hypothetical protein